MTVLDAGYCTRDDVRQELQEASLDAAGGGPLGTDIVAAAIRRASDWLQRTTQYHWYDPDTTEDLLATEPLVVDEDAYDIPAGPHSQQRQLLRDEHGLRYPTTQGGGYARIDLDQRWIQSVTTLKVRNGREYTDWVADADRTQGRGDDYYLESDPQTGAYELYVYARELRPSQDWTNAVAVSLEYGRDAIPQQVRRGVAALAGTDLVLDDDLETAISGNGQLVGVDTKSQKLFKRAMRLLEMYQGASVA